MGRTMPMDCASCGKVLDWGDFGPSGGDPDQAQLDKPQCTCYGWVWNDDCWTTAPDDAAETLPNTVNPYRFTVGVRDGLNSSKWWVHVERVNPHDEYPEHDWWAFPTKEEADTHAALILAALHEAVME